MRKPSQLSSVQWPVGVVLAVAIVAAISAVVLTDLSGEKGSGLGTEFEYDLAELRIIDPALIIYEETDIRFDTGLDWPRAIAVSTDDHIYVAGDRTIHTYDSAGRKRAVEIEFEQAPTSLTVAEDGTLYVGVGDHVKVFDPTGHLKNRWESAGPEAIITSIAVSGADVFVAEFGSRSILHYDTSGNPKGSFGDFVVPSPYFDIALSPDGLLHVANTGQHRVEAYAFNGNLASWWGEFSSTDITGFCGCCNPANFALLPDGEGFVTTEKGLTRVKVYDAKGAFVGVVAGPEQFAQHDGLCEASGSDCNRGGLDVAVDSQGRVLVLDLILGEVRVFRRIKSGAAQDEASVVSTLENERETI